MDGEAGGAPRTLPGPGWFPDPWRVAPFRWWDGTAWTGAVSAPARPALPRSVQWISGVLAAAMVVFGGWAALWLFILPLLAVGDMDNGAFDRDIRTWAVTFVVAVASAGACLVMFVMVRRRPGLGARVLIAPALGAAGMAAAVVLMPGFGAPVGPAASTLPFLPGAMTLTASPNPAPAGAPVTFTVRVRARNGGVAPAGYVSLYLSAPTMRLLGTVPVSGGGATFTAPSLPTGSDRVSAVYRGGATVGLATAQTVVSVYGTGAL